MRYYSIYDLVGVQVSDAYPWCDTLFLSHGVSSEPHRNRDVFFRQLECESLEDLVARLLKPTKKEIMRQKWNHSLLCRGIRKMKRIVHIGSIRQ